MYVCGLVGTLIKQGCGGAEEKKDLIFGTSAPLPLLRVIQLQQTYHE
jgi:hypothetical protein